MHIVLRGNHQPDLPDGVTPWSTEAHWAGSLELLGHTVTRVWEKTASWLDTLEACEKADQLWWVQTYDYAHNWDAQDARAVLRILKARCIPTVAVHLDIWWGLQRAHQVLEEPFFRCEHVFTADGGHDADWQQAGVNHHWMPPGVYEPEAVPGRMRPTLASDIAFVGSWKSYHPEHADRVRLVRDLQGRYRSRFRAWPQPGQPAIRGQALNDLYASTKVVVGDSCFGGKVARYWSDRIPETLGRGGFLIHPHVEGIDDHYTDGVHLALYDGSRRELYRLIDHYLRHETEREQIRRAGQQHVRANHTYTRRASEILAAVARPEVFA